MKIDEPPEDLDRCPVILVVVVRPPTGVPRPSTPGLAAHPAGLVQALLASSPGQRIDGAFGDACLRFDGWRGAVAAVQALRSQLERLSGELGNNEVGCALELLDDAGVPAAATRGAMSATTAGAGEITLSPSLAEWIRPDPPDGLVVWLGDGSAVGGRAAGRLLRASDVVPTNLVSASTSFIGREAEIIELRRRLDHARLVTISGPPGTGKSRLASELAGRVLGRFIDGAWFVSLAPVSDPELVMGAIADAVGIAVAPGQTVLAELATRFRQRNSLLILDNVEHVLAAAAKVATLLDDAPGLQILATSQSPLAIQGESVLPLEPLGLATAGSSADDVPSAAVRLFGDRAAAALPSFVLDADHLPLAVEICRRLDGLPLGIELAAARVRLLPLQAIHDRLDARLAALAPGPDVSERHLSLHAAITWSQELLDPPTRALFRRLSVFRGGLTTDAAAEVCDDESLGAEDPGHGDEILERLAALESASLLARIEGAAGPPRFALLETLRLFGSDELERHGEGATTRRRHADHFLALATRLSPLLMGPEQAVVLDRLGVEHDNIRAALTELVAVDPGAALRLGGRIWRFWQMRGNLAEGGRWIAAALDAAGEAASAADLADGHAAAGGLAYWRGDLDATERHYQRVVTLRRTIVDRVALGDALFDLAFVFDPSLRPPPEDPARTAEGIRVAEEAQSLYLAADHLPGIAKSEWLLGSIVARHDLERARSLLTSSVARFRALGDPFGLGWALHSLGLVLLRGMDSGAATVAFGEALSLFAATADGSATALLLDDFAAVAEAEGDALRASRLRGAAAGARQSNEVELAVANAPWLSGEAVPHGLIDPAALDVARAEGRAMSQADGIAYALGLDSSLSADRGLRISALGPLRIERAGRPVRDWGGPKAGSRHALAIFAFLMDRGERGVTKDEVIEVVWPDAGVANGDLNFHRTLGGLRTTLSMGSTADAVEAVAFVNGRYRLSGAIVSWLDVAEFDQRLQNAAEASDELAAIRGLESARRLYRGDYLDDCPLYGDSEYVEERRGFLRSRLVDALVDLGRRYEARHDQSLASERFREALNVAGGDCPSASAGLRRLGVTST